MKTVNRFLRYVSTAVSLLVLMGTRGVSQSNKEAILPPTITPSRAAQVTTDTHRTGTHGSQQSGLDAIVQVDFTRVSLNSALKQISTMAKLELSYADRTIQSAKLVTLQLKSVTARAAIETILEGTGLELIVRSDGSLIILSTPKVERSQRGGEIIGMVVDSATNAAIVGATVSILGTKIIVRSEKDGSFSIPGVPVGKHTITGRQLGYHIRSVEVAVELERRVNVRLVLPPASTVLSEVVTTVTGQQRKLEIGNDITTINVEEVMKQAPITSVTDLLEARVPGLTVMRTSGVPGAPSRIRLRGIGGGLLSSVSGAPTNDPIIIVDGIRIHSSQSGVDDQKIGSGVYPTPSPIDQIDPNSIDKIEVLRGPSAAAMYGSDAGDGVIVITTKKGQAGPMRWVITGTGGVEHMPGFYAAPGFYRFGHMPLGSQIGGAAVIDPYCVGLGTPSAKPSLYFECAVDSIVRFQALNEPRLSTIGRGHSYGLSATASGGTQQLTYSVTGSISNNLGLTKMPALYQDLFAQLYDSAPTRRMKRPNTMDQKSGQARFAGEFREGVRATFTTSLSQSIQQQSSATSQLAALAAVYIDTVNINPAEIGKYVYQLNSKYLTSNSVLALDFLKWANIPISATFGASRAERAGEGLMPRGILAYCNNPLLASTCAASTKGKFTERRENVTTITTRANGTLFPSARVSTTFGAEITRRSNEAMDGFSDTLAPGISRPSVLIGGTRSGRYTTTGGWFLEPRLNLNSKFFVNPGFRFDGSGMSGSRGGFRGGLLSLFPKMNFSWIAIDREGDEPLLGVISLMRPRFAFGVAGVQPAAEWSLRLLEQDIGNWQEAAGGSPVAPDLGLRLRSVGNSRLGPEKTTEFEGGADIQLWDSRVTFGITGFYKMRKDAIERLPLAPSVGTTMSYFTNVGHVKNTGGEVTLNAVVVDRPLLGWNIDLSVSKYSNRLVRLHGDRDYIDLGNGTRLVEGYPLFGRWSRPIAGWTNPREGVKLRYSDIVVDDSAVYIGMQAPSFEMPFRSSFTFLRGLIGVHSQFNYKAGLTQNNIGSRAHVGNLYENPQSSLGQQAAALAAACFIVEGSQAYLRNMGTPCTDYGFIHKVNSLRWNSVSVNYNVPREYMRRFPFSTLSLSVQGSNLGLWTNYRGKDPDVNSNLIGDVTNDAGQLPMPRTWSLQVRISN